MLFFAAALIPPIYAIVLGLNAMMLGTYTPMYGLLKMVPPFFYFRAPSRFIVWT